MRPLAWVCLVGGILLAVPSFVIAANVRGLAPWPTLLVGICWTAFGVIVLARRGEL
jgi:hypothetical protein